MTGEDRLVALKEQIAAAARAKNALERLIWCRHESLEACPILARTIAQHAVALGDRRRSAQGAG